MFYKRLRRFIVGVFSLIIGIGSLFCGCSAIPSEQPIPYLNSLSVHFLDVGQGDCIFIKLPDGKVALIDCGIDDQTIYEEIKNSLAIYSVKKIDYLFLTHPDEDHVGNAHRVVNDYEIEKAIVPYIPQPQNFSSYNSAYQLLVEKQVEIVYTSYLSQFGSKDYKLIILMPETIDYPNGVYSDFLLSEQPTDKQINNVSTVIYLEYAGVRFLFTGDIEQEADKLLTQNYRVGLYNTLGENKVNLEQIDFLKVAHHGSKDGSSKDLLSLVKAKNAIISVGGFNRYGHPDTQTLTRLKESNANCNILRTDYYGDISVGVDSVGKVSVYAQGNILG